MSKEKSERARIVLSLRDTITGLKQAGNVEGRLKTDLINTHEELAAARSAQVSWLDASSHSPLSPQSDAAMQVFQASQLQTGSQAL